MGELKIHFGCRSHKPQTWNCMGQGRENKELKINPDLGLNSYLGENAAICWDREALGRNRFKVPVGTRLDRLNGPVWASNCEKVSKGKQSVNYWGNQDSQWLRLREDFEKKEAASSDESCRDWYNDKEMTFKSRGKQSSFQTDLLLSDWSLKDKFDNVPSLIENLRAPHQLPTGASQSASGHLAFCFVLWPGLPEQWPDPSFLWHSSHHVSQTRSTLLPR